MIADCKVPETRFVDGLVGVTHAPEELQPLVARRWGLAVHCWDHLHARVTETIKLCIASGILVNIVQGGSVQREQVKIWLGGAFRFLPVARVLHRRMKPTTDILTECTSLKYLLSILSSFYRE